VKIEDFYEAKLNSVESMSDAVNEQALKSLVKD